MATKSTSTKKTTTKAATKAKATTKKAATAKATRTPKKASAPAPAAATTNAPVAAPATPTVAAPVKRPRGRPVDPNSPRGVVTRLSAANPNWSPTELMEGAIAEGIASGKARTAVTKFLNGTSAKLGLPTPVTGRRPDPVSKLGQARQFYADNPNCERKTVVAFLESQGCKKSVANTYATLAHPSRQSAS